MPHHDVHPPVFGPDDHEAGRIEAARLYRLLVGGGTLTPLPNSGIALRDGEQAYGVFNLEYAVWTGAEVTDSQVSRHLFAAGGLLTGGPPGAIAGAAIDKFRARRKEKKKKAPQLEKKAPQWGDITPTEVVLTNTRTLYWLDGRYRPVDHSMIMQVKADLRASSVELEFDDRDSTRLRGPAALWYGVALASLVYAPAAFSTLSAFASFATPPING